MRRLLAPLALLATGSLIAAPSAGATLVCPQGITAPSVYCAEVTPPAATTGAATEITPTSAKLIGTVNTYSAATTYWFEYGTSTSYGSKSGEGSITAAPGEPASATSSSVGIAVSGLSPSTAYHYRLIAKNAGGTTFGADQAFTTANAAGLTLLKALLKAIGLSDVLVPLRCVEQPKCAGTLQLLPSGHKASAAAASKKKSKSTATVYGTAKYSIADGANSNVQVKLSAAAEKLLAKHHRLSTSVVAVANGTRTTIGTVTIKAAVKSKPKHVTHAKTRPGFTG